MAEKRDSWLSRWTGADQLHAELERISGQAETVRAELATERELCAQQAQELEQHKQQRDQLTLENEQLAAEVERLAAQARDQEQLVREAQRRHEQQLTDAERRLASSMTDAKQHKDELTAENKKAKTALSQAQGRIDSLQQAASKRDKELTALHSVHDKILQKNDALEERLSRNEHQLRTVQENMISDQSSLTRALAELAEARAQLEQKEQEVGQLHHELDLTLATSAQQSGALTERTAALHESHERALRDERQRWLLLVSRFWKALSRALGPAATIPLARELEGKAVLGVLTQADSPESASVQLSAALSELTLCSELTIASQGHDLTLRLREPAACAKGAQGWVGVFAVQCLGSMLGRGLQMYGLQDHDGELVVHARFRDQPEPNSGVA